MTRALSPKQRAFINAYSAGPTKGNATQSALKAGYATTSAYMRGAELVKHSQVITALAEAQRDLAQSEAVNRAWVIAKLVTVVTRSLQEISVLDRDGEPTGEYRFDAGGATGALKLIGQHYGMFAAKAGGDASGNPVSPTVINVHLGDNVLSLEQYVASFRPVTDSVIPPTPPLDVKALTDGHNP